MAQWRHTLWEFISLIFAILFFLIVVLVSEREFSTSFQQCIQHSNGKQDNKRDQSNNEDNTTFSYPDTNIGYIGCTALFIDRNDKEFTALATLLIAAFTGTLWLATTRQARLTKEALIADKSASVFPVTFNQEWIRDDTTGLYHWRFRPIWTNSGDTAALKVRFEAICDIRNAPYPKGYKFDYSIRNQQEGFIAPKQSPVGGFAPAFNQAPISPQDIADAQATRKYIYLWG